MEKPTYTLKQIKDYLRSLKIIKFSGIEKDDLNGLTDLLDRLLLLNSQSATVFTNGKLQTESGSRRSIGDLYRIVSYYYPKITLTTLYQHLFGLIAENKVISSICMETGMRVYRATKGSEYGFLNGTPIDEFGVDLKQFDNFDQCENKEGKWGYEYTEEQIKFIRI